MTGSSGARLLRSIRFYQTATKYGSFGIILRRFARVEVAFWSVITGADIGLSARLGARLTLPHPNGVVIHKLASIGDDCMIMQQVTIGQLADDIAPTLGNGVYVGAGAKILGGIHIGDNARIGANAVVMIDVPKGATAVGIPGAVVRR